MTHIGPQRDPKERKTTRGCTIRNGGLSFSGGTIRIRLVDWIVGPSYRTVLESIELGFSRSWCTLALGFRGLPTEANY